MDIKSLPAGEYYIGDLCYVMHKHWREFCNKTLSENFNENELNVVNMDAGFGVLFHSTAYGDGIYYDQNKLSYPVDAGLIGVIAIENIDESEKENIKNGNVYVFNNPLLMSYSDGRISFYDGEKSVSIETSEDIHDEEAEWDDEWND